MGVTLAIVSKAKSPSPDEDEEAMYLKPSLPAIQLHPSAVGIVVHPSGGVPNRPLLPPISDISQPPNCQHCRTKGKKRAVNQGDAPHNPITIDSSPPQPLTSCTCHQATEELNPDHISILPHELRFPNIDFIDHVGLLKAAPRPHGVDPAGYPWLNSIVSGQRSLSGSCILYILCSISKILLPPILCPSQLTQSVIVLLTLSLAYTPSAGSFL